MNNSVNFTGNELYLAMACVKYAVRSPPCNHACFSNKANKKNNNVPGAKCKRQTCMKEDITASGTWEMSDHDRKFVCTFDKQKSLQKFFLSTTKWKNSYRITHPLDKTKKLSRSIAKMRKSGTKRPVKGQPGQFRNAGMGYKAGGKKLNIRSTYRGECGICLQYQSWLGCSPFSNFTHFSSFKSLADPRKQRKAS